MCTLPTYVDVCNNENTIYYYVMRLRKFATCVQTRITFSEFWPRRRFLIFTILMVIVKIKKKNVIRTSSPWNAKSGIDLHIFYNIYASVTPIRDDDPAIVYNSGEVLNKWRTFFGNYILVHLKSITKLDFFKFIHMSTYILN